MFLDFLVPKLPAPKEEDLAKGVLESIDMESYRVEKRAAMQIVLADANAEIDPVPTVGGGQKPAPEIDLLSNVIRAFNEQFGNIDWADQDRVRTLISQDIPAKVAADEAYQHAQQNSDEQNARVEHDKALQRVMNGVLKDDTQLFKMFADDPSFKRWLSDMVFRMTYQQGTPAPPSEG
jgi:type I restriction enzyme, R subunit